MKGLGLDLCQIERMERMMTPAFLERYYTVDERAYIERKGKMAPQTAAALYAAKEAFLKALGVGIGRGILLSEIGVGHDEMGAPYYALIGNAMTELQKLGANRAWLSVTHEAGIAAAVCVLE